MALAGERKSGRILVPDFGLQLIGVAHAEMQCPFADLHDGLDADELAGKDVLAARVGEGDLPIRVAPGAEVERAVQLLVQVAGVLGELRREPLVLVLDRGLRPAVPALLVPAADVLPARGQVVRPRRGVDLPRAAARRGRGTAAAAAVGVGL